MANVKKVTGFSRVSTHLPAQAALVLIDRAVAADRSVSAYVADILMNTLNQKPKPLPQLIGGRRPRSDADPAATAERVLRESRTRQRERAAQVEAQRRTARKI
jgi:hypothetical protein